MTLQDLGAIGEFVGSVGVILTLIYLAVQIRQNTAAMEETQRLSKVDAMFRRNEQMERSMISGALSEEMTEIALRARSEGAESLSQVERSRLFQWELARAFRAEAQYFQWEHGYLDDDYFEHQFKYLILQSGPLWQELGIDYGRPSYKEAVDKILEGTDT